MRSLVLSLLSLVYLTEHALATPINEGRQISTKYSDYMFAYVSCCYL